MIRAILFDIDGTLIRSGGAGVRAFEKAMHTVFALRRATLGLSFCGRTDRGLLREIFQKQGIPHNQQNIEAFFDTYVFWLQHYLEVLNGSVCPGIPDLIHELRALPHPPVLGLLTGNIRLGAELKLRHFKLWDHFELGGFADDHEDRDWIARVAFQRSGKHLNQPISGKDVLVIGDTPLDIQCGRAIDAHVLAVATGAFTLEQLRPHSPDWLLPSLEGVTAPMLIQPAAWTGRL